MELHTRTYYRGTNNIHEPTLLDVGKLRPSTNQPEFGITNKAKYAGSLFATIINIIQNEFKQLNIIAYTASGESRQSLYGQLAKKYSYGAHVYVIPTNTLEVTIISKTPLLADEVKNITHIAQNKLS